jgi:hypothetical protein
MKALDRRELYIRTALLVAVLCVFVATELMARTVQPTLIGGAVANPSDWPASVYASMSGSRCSATVVGPRVLAIAAHCVSNGGKASFSVGPNRYTSTCYHAREYRGNSTADYALCVVDRNVVGIAFESLNTDPQLFKMGESLTLTGYGCIRPGGGGGNDGNYRIGKSRITRLPSGNNNDIVTSGSAALCFGDSGGPAFYISADNRQRWVVSVNSRGDIRSTSYLSSWSSQTGRAYIDRWYSQFGQKICGVHPGVEGCRNGSSGAIPSEFRIDHYLVSIIGNLKPGQEQRREEVQRAVEQALDDMR